VTDSTAGSPTLRVGVVDVYVVCPAPAGWDAWRVLVLQRAAEGTRCPLAWETVHGRLEPGERPEEAALRELREETGLVPARLYNVTTQSFYLHGGAPAHAALGTVQVAVAFCAFVPVADPPVLGGEHQAHAWLSPAEGRERFAWPREREALDHVRVLLGTGDAGPLEDVLRVR
jgi:8-oxo-dGTP pyrophosphatase MutT (NUDIX family)